MRGEYVRGYWLEWGFDCKLTLSCVALVAGLFSPISSVQPRTVVAKEYKMRQYADLNAEYKVEFFATRAEAEAFALAHDLSPECVDVTEAIGYPWPDAPDACERWTEYAVAYNV